MPGSFGSRGRRRWAGGPSACCWCWPVGEIVELVAWGIGVARAGGSRRGAVFALFGSLAGTLAGVFLGGPIPVVGSMVAAVLFTALGAMARAVLGETTAGRGLDASLGIGGLAVAGRLAGTLGKMLVGAMMIAAVLVGMVV